MLVNMIRIVHSQAKFKFDLRVLPFFVRGILSGKKSNFGGKRAKSAEKGKKRGFVTFLKKSKFLYLDLKT